MSNNSKESYVNMPTEESENSLLGSKDQLSSNLFSDAYNFGKNAAADFQGKLRQASLLEYGALVGAVKDAPNEFLHHPWETIGKLSVAGATGITLGAAMAADSPLIVGGAVAASIAGTTASLWSTYVKLSSDKKLQQSLAAVYKSDDKETMDMNKRIATEIIGPEAFNYGVALAGGLYGSEVAENVPLNSLTGRLKPFIPVARTYSDDAVHMTFADGSAIHIHGEQAIYQTHGWEYDLKINNNGIDMETLGSIAGHQVLKGNCRGNSAVGGAENHIKIDIDPKKNITKLSSEIAPSYMHAEKFDKHSSGWVWSSCKQCKIEDDLIDNSPIKPYEK